MLTSLVLSLPVRWWQGPHAEVSAVVSLHTVTLVLLPVLGAPLSEALLPKDRCRVYLLPHSEPGWLDSS